MKYNMVDGTEVSCLDMVFLGPQYHEGTYVNWFMVDEDDHPMRGTKFGIKNVEPSDNTINFDIMTEDTVDMKELSPIVEDFMNYVLNTTLPEEMNENQDSI